MLDTVQTPAADKSAGATETVQKQGSVAATRRAIKRSPLPTVLMHWAMVLALALSLATGLRIAADAPESRVAAALAPVLPQGAVLLWHLAGGILVLGLMLAYSLHQVATGLGRRWLRPPRAAAAAAGLVQRRRLDWLLAWSAFALLGLAAVTGVLQYLGNARLPAADLAAVHRGAAWGLLIYAVAHAALHLSGGLRMLMGMLWPRTVHTHAGTLAALVALGLVAAVVAADRLLPQHLVLARTDSPPRLDGIGNDPAWQRAQPVRLRLARGANLPGGASALTLRGVHDGERAWFLCEWTDPTRSSKHVPLVKTAQGWRILQSAYRDADENLYYEDKLALMLAPAKPWAALASVHLGARPLRGEPGPPGGRGLHYTTDGGILDLWHWKSVRNAAEHQADDNFFGPPLPAPAETARVRDPDSGAWLPRYTAGYRKDPPSTYSGYEMNWEFFDEGRVLPLRLPDDPRDLPPAQQLDLAPDASDAGIPRMTGWIEYNDTRPYADGPDDLPLGTLLPSVLPTGPLRGDRGDIRARGRWSNGRWHLELSRRLDTGSDRDVAIADGVLLWAAVFDHTQTRHAYHLRPVRLRLR